jgi:hypothetical protein
VRKSSTMENVVCKSIKGNGIDMTITRDPIDMRVMVMAPGVLMIPIVSVNGKWWRGTFSASDLMDNLHEVDYPRKRRGLLRSARRALKQHPEIFTAPIWDWDKYPNKLRKRAVRRRERLG